MEMFHQFKKLSISQKFIVMMLTILLLYSIVFTIVVWKQDSDNLISTKMSQLSGMANIFSDEITELVQNISRESGNFINYSGIQEQLVKLSYLSPYYIFSEDELGVSLQHSEQVYSLQSQMQILKNLLQLLSANDLSRVQLYLLSPHDVIPSAKPLLSITLDTQKAMLMKYWLKGNVEQQKLYSAPIDELQFQAPAYYDRIAFESEMNEKIYEDNGFKLKNSLNIPLFFSNISKPPLGPRFLKDDNKTVLQITYPLEVTITDPELGEDIPTPVAVLVVEKNFDSSMLKHYKEKFKIDLGISFDKKLQISTIPGGINLNLNQKNTLSIKDETFYYAQQSLDSKQSTSSELGLLVLSPESELSELVLSLLVKLFLLSFVGAFIVLGFILWFTRKTIISPILLLQESSSQLALGNLDQAIESSRHDELGALAKSFVKMRDAIREKLQVIETQNIELKKADKLKDEFLANTSHELRTPLNGIIGIAEFLIDGAAGKISQEMNDNLNMIVHSGKRLSNLVNDILDFSKMQNQDLQLQLKAVDLKSVVDIVLNMSKLLIGKKPVDLISNIPTDIPLIYADENRLQQILINIIGNSVKFTHKGEISVKAEAKNNRVYISISDTGIGIPKDKQKIIFESFGQADGSTAREYGGTGLGLTITKNLVELHSGKILLDSEEGMGSTFTFDLSIAENQKIEQKEAGQIIHSVESQLSNYQEEISSAPEIRKIDNSAYTVTILIVDDEPINLQVLQNHLSMKNYKILSANDGFQALDILNREKPELMILDLMMPQMSGYEVARKVREKYDSSSLPIIMLTAKNQISDLVEGFRCGANDYLTKPFNKEELYSRVNNLLQLSYITGSYERFVPKEFLRHLGKESIIDVILGDHIQGRMSIIFSDMRSFTSLSESMTPEENFNFINSYLGHMEPIISQYNGFIDKFIGDAIMAVFATNADDATKAGIGMLHALEEYNQQKKETGQAPLKIGIGINTGEMMLGTVGGVNRMEGTVISDAVNLASRIEEMTKIYGSSMLISDSTFHDLEHPEYFNIRMLDRVVVKGKSEPVTVWEVLNGEPEGIKSMKIQYTEIFEKAVSLYFMQKLEEAQDLFAKCLKINPDDKAVNIYVNRCRHYIKHGWDENWDGITRFDRK